MKVKELMAELAKLDPDTELTITQNPVSYSIMPRIEIEEEEGDV